MLFLRLLFALSLGLLLGTSYLYLEGYFAQPPIHEYRTPVQAQTPNYSQCETPLDIEPIMVATHTEDSLAHASGAWIETHLGDNYFVTNAHAVLTREYQEESIVTSNRGLIKEVTGNATVTLHHNGTEKFVKAEVISIINTFNTVEYLSTYGVYFTFQPLADVAILKVDDLPKSFTNGLTQLPLATNKQLPTKLQSSGYRPLGKSRMAKYDLCRFSMYDDNSIAFLDEYDNAVEGMSGSPWVNNQGEIVGLLMISGKLKSHNATFTVSHIEDDIMLLSFSNIYPDTLKTYAFATPVKWVYAAIELADNE